MRKIHLSPKVKLAVACILWGTLGIFVKRIPLSSPKIVSVRALIASIVFIIVGKKQKKLQFQDCPKKELVWVCLCGVAMGLGWMCLFASYQYTTVSISTLCNYIGPTVVAVIAPFLFNETFQKHKLIAVLLSAVGLYFVVQSPAGPETGIVYQHSKGIFFAFLATIPYALVIIVNKRTPSIQGLPKALLQVASAAVVCLPILLTSLNELLALSLSSWVLLLILGSVHTAFSYLLYFSAIEEANTSDVVMFSYLDPITAVFLSAVLLKEPFSFSQLIGGLLILGAATFSDQLYLYYQKHKKKSA